MAVKVGAGDSNGRVQSGAVGWQGMSDIRAVLDAAEQYATAEVWAGHPLAIILEALIKQTRAATLLQQPSGPALVVVPVAVSERLPGEGDCDAEGTCWVWNFTAYTWGLFRLDLTAHSHWCPANAIPLPQAGEVPNG